MFMRCVSCTRNDDTLDTGMVMDVDALEEEIGDMSFVRTIIRETIADVGTKMANIERFTSVRDYESLLIDSHGIKGVALTMKCADLASVSSSLENLMNRVIDNRLLNNVGKGKASGHEGDVRRHVRRLKHEVERLKKFECTYETN